jgi:hypothetical protein
MTSIFKKVDEVVQFRTEITKTLFSIATMMACVVEKEALTMAFEVEKEKKLNALDKATGKLPSSFKIGDKNIDSWFKLL